MPSLRQIISDYAPVAANITGGIVQRRGATTATNRLTTGANRAMDTITAGSDRAERTMADVYGQQQRTLAPFRAAGESTLPGLTAGVAPGGEYNKPFTMADFELYKDPGFQFRVSQGERAIKAGANAGGIRFSGATLKALSQFNQDSASQEAQAAYNRQQNDVQNRFERVSDVAGIGERAAGAEVTAGGTYGANLSRLHQSTAAQLADLQTDLASAEAAGDITKANAINDTISGILSTVENTGTAKSMAKLMGMGGGAAAAGGAATAGTSLAAITAGAVPAIPMASTIGGSIAAGGSVAGGLAGTTGATAATGTAAGGAGLGSAAVGLLTNPITIAAGAALGVGILWSKSQAHHEASDWVKNFQDPFDKQVDAINRDTSLAPEHKMELKRAAGVDYLAASMEFAKKKGSDGRKVIGQAMDTFRKYYSDLGLAT